MMLDLQVEKKGSAVWPQVMESGKKTKRSRKRNEKRLKVIDSRLRAVGGDVVLRDKRYAKGSHDIESQCPGAKANFENVTAV